MGDLCVDALIDGSDSSSFAQLGLGAEAAVRSSGRLSVGGSAWLMARAAMETGFFSPVMLSAVGSDAWAQTLLACVREAGLPAAAIQQVAQAATDLVAVITMAGRQRVMFLPAEATGNRLDAGFVLGFLSGTDASRVAWAFLSGYALAGRNSARRASAKVLADWAREHEIPVVLDLVPHQFRASVGTLGEVASHLGPPDVLIGNLSTFQQLGYSGEGDGHDIAKDMERVAVQASRDWGTVVTQAFTRSGVFGQTAARRGSVLFSGELVIPASGARGAGDRLAAEALHRLGGYG